MSFQLAIKWLFSDEAEGTTFVDDSHDAGGATKFGISQRAYLQVDIANLTAEAASAIYLRDYYNKCSCSLMPDGLDIVVFDTAVNCGQGTAAKLLQDALHITQDGIIGEQTIATIKTKNTHELIKDFLRIRLYHYNEIESKNESTIDFMNGWYDRVIALSMFIGAN